MHGAPVPDAAILERHLHITAPTSGMLHITHGSSERCECVQHVARHLGMPDASTCMCTLTSAKTSVKVPPRSIEKRSVLPSLAPSIADQTYRWGTAGSGTALHLPQKLDACQKQE